jgi:hypothetical protein
LPKFIVPLSEKFRAAANSHFCREYGDGTSSFALFGHANDRPPDAVGDHRHAFYLPMAKPDDSSGFLSDLHIWCPYGLTQAEVAILLRISRLDWGSGRYPVRPVLTALSKEPPSAAPFSIGRTASKLWRSASPFVPPRYFYRGGRSNRRLKANDQPEYQLIECLKAAGVKTGGTIFRLGCCKSGLIRLESLPPVGLWDVVRAPEGPERGLGGTIPVDVHRNGGGRGQRHERRVGLFFEIEFDEPVSLPVPAHDHSCHFGLGLFVPADNCD